LSLPASAVGERTVSLRPAGELDVMVLGVPPGYEANLQILALDETHPLLLEHLVRGEVHFAFDGWRPGSFRCQLAVGRDTEAHVLADERVEVRVGQRSSTTLIFPERHDEGPGGSVDGVLAMPESEFDLGDLAAELSLVLLPEAPGQLQLARSSYALTRRLDAMERTPMGADARLWRFDDVPPGDYVLLVRPLGLTRALRVEPGRALHVELELPPLAHSRVRWTRTAGGRGVRLAELSTTLAEETVRELGAFDVRQQFVEADGTYVLTSVPGRLRLCALESDMTPRVEEIDAASGWNDFEFLLGAPPRITLDLQLDGQAYAVDLAFWFGVEVAPVVTGHRLLAVLAKGEEHGGRPANHHAAYDFSERGSFHFVFPALEGFDPIAPRTLSTDSPEPATIELVRRP
jgi:hypothetical protein